MDVFRANICDIYSLSVTENGQKIVSFKLIENHVIVVFLSGLHFDLR